MIVVGLIMPFAVPSDSTELVMHRRTIVGSLIGGTSEYGPYLDFCGKHNITSTVELVRLEDVNAAYPRAVSAQVRYRYVIDMARSMNGAKYRRADPQVVQSLIHGGSDEQNTKRHQLA